MSADQPLDHAADPLRWRMYLVWLFRGILQPEAGSDVLRGGLEESLESLGHLVLLLVTLRALPADASPEDADAPADRPRTGGSLSLPSSIGGMEKGRT